MSKSIKRALMSFLGVIGLAASIVSCAGSEDQNRANKQRELDERKAQTAVLQEVAGLYKGQVVNDASGAYPFWIQLNVYVVDEPNGTNEDGETKLRPTLRAQYIRPDDNIDVGNEISMTSRYYPETREIVFVSTTFMGGPNSATDPRYRIIQGRFEDSKIIGTVSDFRGLLGNVTLVRK